MKVGIYMLHFLYQRINKLTIIIPLTIGVIIAISQFILNVLSYLQESNHFYETVYTKWLAIDPFSIPNVLFYLILPLLAAIPCGMLLKSDLKSGYFNYLKLRFPLKKIYINYFGLNFFIGSLSVIFPLIINFFLFCLIYPLHKPDFLLNNNLLIISQNTLFVNLYYTHPFIHVCLFIIFTGIWGGLFTSFVMVNSLWMSNYMMSLISGFALQLLLIVVNSLFTLPNQITYVPASFLRETSDANVSLVSTIIVTLLMIVYIVIVCKIGGKKLVD